MSILTYLILGVVAVYLFQVNPLLCIAIAGAVAFFKIRGIFGGRRYRTHAATSHTTEAALVAMCLTLLEWSERAERQVQGNTARSGNHEDDPLGGLFLD